MKRQVFPIYIVLVAFGLMSAWGCAPKQVNCRCYCETSANSVSHEAAPSPGLDRKRPEKLKIPATFMSREVSPPSENEENPSELEHTPAPLNSSSQPQGACSGEIKFKDREMELAVRMLLKKPEGPVSASEVLKIEYFTNEAGGGKRIPIADLTGIECFSNLTVIQIWSSKIVDLSPIRGLQKLTHIEINDSLVTNIQPVASLPNLEELHLNKNKIKDISPLSSLTKLTLLGLDSNNIADASPLRKVTSLKQLSLGNNQIRNIKFVEKSTALEMLNIGGNKISDISPLSGALPQLRYLNITKNPINDLTPLVKTLGGGIIYLEGLGIDCVKQKKLLESLSIKWHEMYIECPEFWSGV
jgi:Leucine-rich repeat (LRR) protein